MRLLFRMLPVLLAVLVIGCPKRAQLARPDNPGQGLDQALAALEARKFAEAEEKFTFLIFNFPGTRQAADAQFYLAETYFRKRDYIQAQTEYDFYLKSFPNGRFQEQATYKLGLCHFRSAPQSSRDQTSTLKAREILEEFLILYPDSELKPEVEDALADVKRQLTSQDFNIAHLYFKAGEFKSALVYYEYVAGKFPAEQWNGPDRLRLGICYQETDQPEKAKPILEEIAQGDYAPALKQQAGNRLGRMD